MYRWTIASGTGHAPSGRTALTLHIEEIEKRERKHPQIDREG